MDSVRMKVFALYRLDAGQVRNPKVGGSIHDLSADAISGQMMYGAVWTRVVSWHWVALMFRRQYDSISSRCLMR